MSDLSVGEANSQLFLPDTLLPSQFFAALRRKTDQGPERRLVLAILQDAVGCYQKHLFARDLKSQQLFRDAEEWILSEEREHFFSFENICQLIDIEPEFLRRGLLEWARLRRSQRARSGAYQVNARRAVA